MPRSCDRRTAERSHLVTESRRSTKVATTLAGMRPEESSPVEMRVGRSVPQRRLTVLFRLILVIPQAITLYFVGIAAFFVAIFGWFAALFTGRLPSGCADYLSGWLRWSARLDAYFFLLTDRHPPYSFDPSPTYPVDLTVVSGRLNRWAVLFRYFLALPASIAAGALIGGLAIFSVIMWVATLIRGQLPSWMFEAAAAAIRYRIRFNAYFFMLTSFQPAQVMGDGDLPPTALWSGTERGAGPWSGPPGPIYGTPPPPPSPPAPPWASPVAGVPPPPPPPPPFPLSSGETPSMDSLPVLGGYVAPGRVGPPAAVPEASIDAEPSAEALSPGGGALPPVIRPPVEPPSGFPPITPDNPSLPAGLLPSPPGNPGPPPIGPPSAPPAQEPGTFFAGSGTVATPTYMAPVSDSGDANGPWRLVLSSKARKLVVILFVLGGLGYFVDLAVAIPTFLGVQRSNQASRGPGPDGDGLRHPRTAGAVFQLRRHELRANESGDDRLLLRGQ